MPHPEGQNPELSVAGLNVHSVAPVSERRA